MEIIYEEILEETADSIEALSEDVFACATYQLLERENEEIQAKRTGSVMIYNIEKGSVKRLQTIKTNAILDMKWHRKSDEKMLTTADSKGEVHFYSTSDDNSLQEKTMLVVDEDALCLSADWYKTDRPNKLAYSLSSGNLAIVQLGELEPTVIKTWKGHSLEAWIIACDYVNPDILYSGADDCLLKMWDLRSGVDLSFLSTKSHILPIGPRNSLV